MANLEGKFPLTAVPDLTTHIYGVRAPYGAGDDYKILTSEFLDLYDAKTAILSNKSINTATNTIIGITNTNISNAAGIEVAKLQALTFNRAASFGPTGILAASTVTTTELDYLIGVTSNIQTQLNSKGIGDLVDGGNATGSTIVIGTNDGEDVEFETSGTIRMTISGVDGDVSIGSPSSGAKLTVDSNDVQAIPVLNLRNTPGGFNWYIGNGSPDTVINGAFGDKFTDLDTGDTWTHRSGSGNWTLDISTDDVIIIDGGQISSGTLDIGTNNAESFAINTNGTPALLIDTSQQLGLGATPTSKFHVDSNAAATTAIVTVENSVGNYQVFLGSGSPEGTVTGSIGDRFTDITNGRPYIKRTGAATNTGWVPETPSFAQYTNTDTATELNTVTDTEVPIMGTQIFLDDDFSVNGNGIQCDFDGVVEVSYAVHHESFSSNVSIEGQISVGGSLDGAIASGYIRDTAGATEATLACGSQLFSVTSGDVILIVTRRHGNPSGSATMVAAGDSYLSVKRLR